jgi:hypothetical protein
VNVVAGELHELVPDPGLRTASRSRRNESRTSSARKKNHVTLGFLSVM